MRTHRDLLARLKWLRKAITPEEGSTEIPKTLPPTTLSPSVPPNPEPPKPETAAPVPVKTTPPNIRAGVGESSVEEGGITFSTGQPVRFPFIRNLEKAPKDPHNTFGQDQEPHGRFMLHRSSGSWAPPGWEEGEIEFRNPLVIELTTDDHIYGDNGWKARLSRAYGGKKGRALSRALARDGFDGIITVRSGSGETSEIVDLTMFHGR